jgi:uncharacterized protein
MPDFLLAIGMFVFGVPRLAYSELRRRAEWRWAEAPRFGERDAAQFLGPGLESISLSGLLVPEIAGDFTDIERLREMAATGEVWPVVLGTGEVLGEFRIDSIDDNWGSILPGGRARATGFDIMLTRMDTPGDTASRYPADPE